MKGKKRGGMVGRTDNNKRWVATSEREAGCKRRVKETNWKG